MGLFKRKRAENAAAIKEAHSKDKSMLLTVSNSGFLLEGIKPDMAGQIIMWKREDGLVYFDDDINVQYEPMGFELLFDRTGNKISREFMVTGEKIKRTGRVVGAAIGGALFGPVGAAVGAAYGTGNSNTMQDGHWEDRTAIVNLPDGAAITLRRTSDDEVVRLCLVGSKGKMIELGEFIGLPMEIESEGINRNADTTTIVDPFAEAKKLAELRDEGIITEEEFSIKKRQILGL